MNFEGLNRFQNFQFSIACQIPVWAKAYGVAPAEIERQILIAHAWIVNNPKRAPKSDVMRYLNSWMSIADRKGSMRRTERRMVPRAPEPEPEMTWEEMVEIRKRNMARTTHGTAD